MFALGAAFHHRREFFRFETEAQLRARTAEYLAAMAVPEEDAYTTEVESRTREQRLARKAERDAHELAVTQRAAARLQRRRDRAAQVERGVEKRREEAKVGRAAKTAKCQKLLDDYLSERLRVARPCDFVTRKDLEKGLREAGVFTTLKQLNKRMQVVWSAASVERKAEHYALGVRYKSVWLGMQWQ